MDYLTLALILFALGVVMLIAEILLPTGGFLVVASLLLFALGVGVILKDGTVNEAAVALAALAIGLPAAGYVAVAAWRRMAIGTVLSDEGVAPGLGGGVSELEALKNRTGKTVTPLRPSGAVEFDGKRIDAMSEGMMLETGVWVRCVEVKGGKVIVREIDPPADLSEITPDAPPRRDVPDIHLDVSPPVPPPPKKLTDKFDDFDFDLDK
jgi:membrane-bound serine protease (ClpP class)